MSHCPQSHFFLNLEIHALLLVVFVGANGRANGLEKAFVSLACS